MVEEPIRQYSEATEEFNRIYSKIREMGSIIGDVSWCLNNKPYELGITNSGVGFPPEAFGDKRFTLDVNNWPTGKGIAEALAELYNARRKVKNAWANLSSTDKSLVKRPDSDLMG